MGLEKPRLFLSGSTPPGVTAPSAGCSRHRLARVPSSSSVGVEDALVNHFERRQRLVDGKREALIFDLPPAYRDRRRRVPPPMTP
jgi:hypothetical protein